MAIATGAPGPDVVDVDNHGEHDNGFGTLNHLKRAGLVDGYHAVVQTPSDGFHLYYRGTDQGNGSARGYRIDFRSKGGYVVAPPSATPAGRYVVVKHSPAAEASTVSWDAIRGELPRSLSRGRGALSGRQTRPRALTGSWSGPPAVRPGIATSRCSGRRRRRTSRASWTARRSNGLSTPRSAPA